ncbi:glycosyl hydrolase 115 family protein [Desertivirga arenae]|uniref:glycosyl hydrolase 115 family protein n=1 Tax=Desertivirga arenae TaxID=2810309 RepID=UPI001A95A077|nr:glycosyl hydrolase 115 family protein [Pedobacter sp. SYSU D00823]
MLNTLTLRFKPAPIRFSLSLLSLLFLLVSHVKAGVFKLVTPETKVSIVYAVEDRKLDSIAANLLAKDIERVTGYLPGVSTNLSTAQGNVIIIGTIQSSLIRSFDKNLAKSLINKWECFGYKVIRKPNSKILNALLIAGSDLRGTAYGVFGISEKIGVSPWYWWADAHPVKQPDLSLEIEDYISKEPSVKFRGIFLNDEDWGLQPWAAKNYESQGVKDIGPKTYAQIFELLLRLKANLIWPAMHESTKAYYHYPQNKEIAADYEIVVSSSHAEPMLRNNVDEWNAKTSGAFNYKTNKANVLRYWEDRIKESKGNNVIYTMGMRGVHDSGMEGVKTVQETVPLLEQIFADQRELLSTHIHQDIEKVPQTFSIYKEVLDVYEAGLKVPEDIILNWPDDNYGYIQRLGTPAERKRKGGAGVYYHASYWGRPHDYLWLSSTNPALMREEMTKAYIMDARKIWVLNIGDIKPAEYNMQLFLDMAYNVDPFMSAGYVAKHSETWAGSIFGTANAKEIAGILSGYYKLAFERRPEFMGWSRTEPTTPVNYTAYVHHRYGDEAEKRIGQYEALEKSVALLKPKISASLQDAYYELVEYPVKGAANMNKKFLYRDKAWLYALQGRASAQNYVDLARKSYDEIVKATDYYNNSLANGKWKWMMSMKPRELPVYQLPAFNAVKAQGSSLFIARVEGLKDSALVDVPETQELPAFNRYLKKRYFIDVYLSADSSLSYQVEPSAKWIRVSRTKGLLSSRNSFTEERLWVDIDWTKAPEQLLTGEVNVKAPGKEYRIKVTGDNRRLSALENYEGFIESDGYIAIDAANYTNAQERSGRKWTILPTASAGRNWVEALPLDAKVDTGEQPVLKSAALEFDFYNLNSGPAKFYFHTIPTHPLNNQYQMRYAVKVDEGPVKVLNFKTVGRSEEWKENVLRNNAVKSLVLPNLAAGKHKLRVYMIDPGVIFDRIYISLDGRKSPYSAVEQTYIGKKNK